jgi:hypothetical protein
MPTTELRSFLCLFAFAAGFLTPSAARAHDDSSKTPALILVDDKTDKVWLSDARARYPIDTCVVSGERLDDHAESKRQDMIYREPGKPDRLVRFCCKSCITDFEKDPAKFLKLLDEAAAKKIHP